MKIQILISKNSWASQYKKFILKKLNKFSKNKEILSSHNNLKKNYDINIIFSYFKKIPEKYLKYSKFNLVPHESDLPKGKGMSPLSWQILENKNKISFSLIEASSKIDNGLIYYKKNITISKSILLPQIKKIQLHENLKLIEKFLKHYKKYKKEPRGLKQIGMSSYYKKRNKKDSKLNINKSIKKQFNLLRTVDNNVYPAFFEIYGKKFFLRISEK